MSRILPALVFADLVLLCAAAALGWFVDGDRWYAQHFGLAMFALVLTLLIHVVVFTYFSVTGRMISQAVFIGRLDRAPLERVRAHKRRVARCVGSSFLVIVVVAAFGALTVRNEAWHLWHLAAAFGVVAVNSWAFYVEYDFVVRQGELMTRVLSEYEASRPARQAIKPSA